MRWRIRILVAVALTAAIGGSNIQTAHALAGFHGMSVSSWDTSASTVVLTTNAGFFSTGRLIIAGYSSNFSSTTGNLSSQFCINYLNYKTDDMGSPSHGISGSAVALFGIPLADRYDNGLVRMALNFYLGGAPAALISSSRNYLSIPAVLGIGMQFSPIRYLSIVPWFELAPSVNIGTSFESYSPAEDIDESDIDAEDGEIPEEDVEDIVEESVNMDVTVNARLRGGLTFAIHLGNRVDFQIQAVVSHVGEEFSGPVAVFAGGAFVFAWDDPAAKVLPAEKRLEKENCNAVEERFKKCPAYNRMMKDKEPEQQDEKAPPAPVNSPPPQPNPPAPKVDQPPQPVPQAAPPPVEETPQPVESNPTPNENEAPAQGE